jgi:putative flippase GtrA
MPQAAQGRHQLSSADRLMQHNLTIRRFVRFAGVGGLGTAVHYAVLILLVQLFRADPVPASIAGFFFGACANFLMSHHFAFESRLRLRETAPRFFAVAAVGFFINWLAMLGLVSLLKAHYIVAQMAATLLVLLTNFFANATWTFRGERGEN